MCSVYGMLYSVAVNGRTFVILFGEIFLDRFMFDHETVSILHYSIYNLPHAMLCLYQNCWLMTIGLVHTTLNSLSYSAATAIIRYVYVRSSLQANRQEVLKRNAFIFKAIFIVESIGFINLYSFYVLRKEHSGVERLPLLIYQTCLDPWSRHQISSMPVTYVILTQTADLCIICFNIYLYTYLNKQSRENTGIRSKSWYKRINCKYKLYKCTKYTKCNNFCYLINSL